MIRRIGTARRGPARRLERGQGIVEFALVVPLFFLLLLAMIDFGFAFYTNLTIEYASREGARIGAALAAGNSRLPCAQVDSYVVAAVQRVLESAGIKVDLNPGGGGGVNWIRIYNAAAADGSGYATAGNYNEWTYSPGGGPTVDGVALDFVGPTEAAAPWKACTRLNGVTPDHIGVAINYTYAWITPIARITTLVPTFSSLSQLSMVDKTVMALNPTTP